MGELTVAVRSGKLTRAELKPISSAILKGSDTYATLNLLDALSNPISPDLHTIDIETENGYIIAPDGTKKQNYRVDLMESSLNMRIGGFDVGQIRVRVKVDSVFM